MIKVESGNIFGCLTEKPWSSNGKFVIDPHAYIFNLVNKKERTFKVMCSNNDKNAIGCWSEDGPCYGGGDYNDIDINIVDQYNTDSSFLFQFISDIHANILITRYVRIEQKTFSQYHINLTQWRLKFILN